MTRPWLDRLAHDLRGPLTSLQTAAYLLKTDPRGANAQELAEIIVRQGQRLGRMIEELDDWARVEQQRLLDERAPVELAAMLDLALTGVPGCTIESDIAEDAQSLVVDGDQARLTQLFRIMLAQSMSRDPGARMRVHREDETVVVTLSDRGPALADEQLEHLLTTSQHPAPDDGLGLRLLIAAAIAEAHGGSLEARRPPSGEGLELRCTLPLA
jgi:signal transduction histidine kinase